MKMLVMVLILGILALSVPDAYALNGRKTVTTAGTAVALVSRSTPFTSALICPETDNTGLIAVSYNESPVAAEGTQEGAILTGDAVCASITFDRERGDLALIQLDSTVNGDGVTYEYINEKR